jgi:outer membrane protein TolC
LRANTLVSQARIILLRSEDGLRIARRKLGLITGLPENAVLAEPAPLEAPEEGYERLREVAFANREDYAKAKLNQDVAAENITIVRGAHLPQFYAEGGLRYKSAVPSTLDEGTTYYGGLRLEVPIFEGGLMKHEVSEAKSKLRQSELSTALMKRSIESEVYEASVNLQTETSVLVAVKQQYDDARSNFSTVEGLFGEGLASSLQLIDAQQSLLFTEQEYVNVLYDHQLAILRLQRAVGLLGKQEKTMKEGSHASS